MQADSDPQKWQGDGTQGGRAEKVPLVLQPSNPLPLPLSTFTGVGFPSQGGAGERQAVPAWLTSTESLALRVLYTHTYKISKQLELATPSCLWELTVLRKPLLNCPRLVSRITATSREEGIRTGPD